jgi:hypothetical protein
MAGFFISMAGFGGLMAGLAGFRLKIAYYRKVLETINTNPPLFQTFSKKTFLIKNPTDFPGFWRVWRVRPSMAGFWRVLAGLAGFGLIFYCFFFFYVIFLKN